MWSGVPTKKYFQIRGLQMTNEGPRRVMNRSLVVKWASSELIVCHCMANYHHFTAKDDLDNIHFLCTVVLELFFPHLPRRGSFLKSVKSAHVIIMTVGHNAPGRFSFKLESLFKKNYFHVIERLDISLLLVLI